MKRRYIDADQVVLATFSGMDKHEDLQKQFNIENYPHISLFVNGAQIKYNEVGYGVSLFEAGRPVHELH